MFAIKSSADVSRYVAVTHSLAPGRIVQCPTCRESFTLYAKTPALTNRAMHRLTDYLAKNCPRHVEYFAADEAA